VGRKVDDSFEVVRDKVERKVWQELDNHDPRNGEEIRDMYLVHTFSDAVIVKNTSNDKLYEVPYRKENNEVFLGRVREVDNIYAYKKLQSEGIDPVTKGLRVECELTGPIVMKDNTRQIAYAPILVPGEEDHDGETVTKEKIEEAAHEWMLSYRNVDIKHTLNNVGVPVESYITPKELRVNNVFTGGEMVIPEGSWIMASKVLNEETWQDIEDGNLIGYSVMGIKRQTFEQAVKEQTPDVALKKTLLRDLGPDWVAAAVSIVDEPAVPKAKFFALKSKEPEPNTEQDEQNGENEKGVKGFFKGLFGKKEGMRFSEEVYRELKEAFTHLKYLVDEADKEREEKGKSIYGGDNEGEGSEGSAQKSSNKNSEQGGEEEMEMEKLKEMVEGAVKEAVEPIQEEITSLKSQIESGNVQDSQTGEGEEGDEGNTDSTNTDTDTQDQGNEELESFKSEVVQKLEELENRISKKFTSSKSLTGQDGDKEGEPERGIKGRDAFGRKKRGEDK